MKCRTKFCRSHVLKSGKSPFCSKCKHHRWKAKNPLRYFWNCLKSGARWRGKPFSLTFDQYREFALSTGYFGGKGKTASSLSIDRIDDSKGYEVGNIQVLTLSENTRKRFVPRIKQYAEQFGVQL